MTHLTYAERERAAYCAGHTRAADLLGALADAEQDDTSWSVPDIVEAWRKREWDADQAMERISKITDSAAC